MVTVGSYKKEVPAGDIADGYMPRSEKVATEVNVAASVIILCGNEWATNQ